MTASKEALEQSKNRSEDLERQVTASGEELAEIRSAREALKTELAQIREKARTLEIKNIEYKEQIETLSLKARTAPAFTAGLQQCGAKNSRQNNGNVAPHKIDQLSGRLSQEIKNLLTSNDSRLKLWRLGNYLILLLTFGIVKPENKTAMWRLHVLLEEHKNRHKVWQNIPEKHVKWIKSVKNTFQALMQSKRWRIGDRIARLPRHLTGRKPGN
ncbi:MAG: hypothetical protein R2874_12345 [Desulfobacterales bacterium]